MPSVGVKFCGGCNPSIDRSRVYHEIRGLARDFTFGSFDDADIDALLFICGCQTACPVESLSGRIGFHGRLRTVVVAGEMVDGGAASEEAIPTAVVEKLRDLAI